MTQGLLVGIPVGLAVGSLAGNAAARWPAGLTLGRPARSRCDGCSAPIAAVDLIPVLGWLRRRGRCAVRGCRIPPDAPLLEVGSAIVAGLALAVPGRPTGVLVAGTGIVLLLATALDVRHRWIPDRLTLTAGAVLVPAALAVAVAGAAPVPAGRPLLLAFGVASLLAVVRRVTEVTARGAWIGGGDVKLLVPVVAVAALEPTGPSVLWAGTATAGSAVAAAGWVRGRASARSRGRSRERTGAGTGLPLAPLLLVGWSALLAARLTGST